MPEIIPDTPAVDPMKLAVERGQPDLPQAAEAVAPQVNPGMERMKKAEKAFFGSADSLIKQIDDGELGVDDTDFEGRTAVMMMAARGQTDAVKELITRKADLNRVNMYQGRIPMSALDAARQTNRKDIEQLLVENGAKSGQELEAERLAAEQTR